jgi:hypothetical protein
MGTTHNSREHILSYNWKMKWKQARQTFDENGQVKIGLLNKHFELARAEDEEADYLTTDKVQFLQQ